MCHLPAQNEKPQRSQYRLAWNSAKNCYPNGIIPTLIFPSRICQSSAFLRRAYGVNYLNSAEPNDGVFTTSAVGKVYQQHIQIIQNVCLEP